MEASQRTGFYPSSTKWRHRWPRRRHSHQLGPQPWRRGCWVKQRGSSQEENPRPWWCGPEIHHVKCRCSLFFSPEVSPTVQLLLPSPWWLGFIVPLYTVVTREDFPRAFVSWGQNLPNVKGLDQFTWWLFLLYSWGPKHWMCLPRGLFAEQTAPLASRYASLILGAQRFQNKVEPVLTFKIVTSTWNGVWTRMPHSYCE